MKRLSFRAQLLLALCACSFFAGVNAAQPERGIALSRAFCILSEPPLDPAYAGLYAKVRYRAYDDLSENEKWQFNEIMKATSILLINWQVGAQAATDDEMEYYEQIEKNRSAAIYALLFSNE